MSSPKKTNADYASVIGTMRHHAENKDLVCLRANLLQFSAQTFGDAGNELFALGSADSVASPKPIKLTQSDEAVAVSILIRIAAQLVVTSADLFADGRHYAAAALLRQLVEVEYLVWAIDVREQDGTRWLRSNRETRRSSFSPARLRKAAKGKFRSKDYSFHCEFGGHPTPLGGFMLLEEEQWQVQMLVTDLLGHAGRIWDHLARWAERNPHGDPILERSRRISLRFSVWKAKDPLARLPPPDL